MKLSCTSAENAYEFQRVALRFDESRYADVFSSKNNKTLQETIRHHRYAHVRSDVLERYSTSLGLPLGTFLYSLKVSGDPFYRRFLNRYGDGAYSSFSIADEKYRRMKGIYAYVLEGKLMYIGRCRDSMSKRVDQGYGRIHPKNCFVDGQATNCHLNALITAAGPKVELWFCSIESNQEIEAAERTLIQRYDPPWNIQR